MCKQQECPRVCVQVGSVVISVGDTCLRRVTTLLLTCTNYLLHCTLLALPKLPYPPASLPNVQHVALGAAVVHEIGVC